MYLIAFMFNYYSKSYRQNYSSKTEQEVRCYQTWQSGTTNNNKLAPYGTDG